MSRKKITVVGAGNVGASVAAYASAQELGDVVLLDILEGVTQGRALDIFEATPIYGVETRVFGTQDYGETKDSDLIIITAGIARRPGMSRDDLLATNVKIVGEVAEKSFQASPNAIMIVVSNPLDAMVYTAWRKTGCDPRRVMGMGGLLDSTRFRSFLAEEIGVSAQDIQVPVLGGRGDTMVIPTRLVTVGGYPVTEFIPPHRLEQIVQRTREGGAEIVKLLRTGSAYYAPAVAAIAMANAILRDEKRLIHVAAYLDGEFGEKGIFVGVPAILGAEGVEKVIDVELSAAEDAAFKKSVAAVTDLVVEVDGLL